MSPEDVLDTLAASEGPDDNCTEEAVVEESRSTSDGKKASDTAGLRRGVTSAWVRRILIGSAVLAVTGTVTGAGYLGWLVKQQRDLASASSAALDTARNYAVTLTTVDNGSIDENFRQVLDGATGEFRDVYSESSAQLRQALIDNEATSQGTVVEAAVKAATTDQVEVLIFVDQSISNRIDLGPRIDRSRISMTLDRIDGRWLASRVDVR